MAEDKSSGRPTDYKDEYVHLAQVACEEGGFTDAKLAKLFKCSRSTISLWKKEHPKFKAALLEGKWAFDSTKVEKAFLKRCLGFRYTETTREPAVIKKHLDGNAPEVFETEMTITKKVSKVIVPDARACMDWLTNRQPGRWKKVKHVEVTGAGGGPVQTQKMAAVPSGPMSIAQWEAEVKEARKFDTDIELDTPGNA